MYEFEYNEYTLLTGPNSVIDVALGFAGIPVRASEDPNTGADGGNIWAQNYNMRPLTIGGQVFADDLTTYYNVRRQILAAFNMKAGKQTMIVTRPDGVIRTIDVRVTGEPEFIETPGEVAEAVFQMSLKAEDPFFSDVTPITDSAIIAIAGGTPVASPVSSPIGKGAGNQIVLVNSGDVSAYASFKMIGNVTNGTVTKAQTGEFFRIDGNIGSGQSVDISREQGDIFVTDQDGVNKFSDLEGDLFLLDVGTNTVVFTASASAAGALLEITFFPKYRTI